MAHPTQKPVARPEEVDLDPVDVLRCAATYIGRHGFHQGDMYALITDLFPPACAQGAVKMAICGNPYADYTRRQVRLFDNVMRMVADHLLDQGALGDITLVRDDSFDSIDSDMTSSSDLVAEWNDEAERTAADVINALNAAADHAHALHHKAAAQAPSASDTTDIGGGA